MTYVISAALALLMIGLVRRVVRFAFRRVVALGVLALFSGVLVKSLHAQETMEIYPAAFFRLGAWNHDAGKFQIVAAPKIFGSGDTDLIVVEIFLDIGDKMNFTGTLYQGAKQRLAQNIAARYGLPGADVICGVAIMEFGYVAETMCIIFKIDSFDGYTVASDGSKHYQPVIQVGLVIKGRLIWSGTMRTDSPFVVDVNGRVVW